MNNSVVYDYTKGFKFYLHERDQFWRGIEMDRIGQTQAILIPTRSEVWGTFRAVLKTNLAKESAQCVTDPHPGVLASLNDTNSVGTGGGKSQIVRAPLREF